ncbi:MAG: glycosyltransferase, partial [Pseudomonadota bacterium]
NRSEILRQRGYLLIGGEGPLKERLLSMVQDYNLMPCLRLLGHIPEQDLPRLYQAADFFVLPTRHLEGFGLVILEALASGTPVLGTPVGAIPEVIGPFNESLLFKSAQWQDMMEKMEDVIQRPEKYDIPPKACRSFAEENFSWQRMSLAFEREALRIIRLI